MSIHIPPIFLNGNGNGNGAGHGHNSNYLVNNKYASGAGSGAGSGACVVNEIKFKFDEDTTNYFYNELSKILNTDTKNGTEINGTEINENTIVYNNVDSISIDEDSNFCLITKEKLEPNHITLSCNHKFNYVALYHEVVNQKNKLNNMYEITKLLSNQIKCPYCRTTTNKLLPYIPYPSVRIVKNVNSYITSSHNSNPNYFLYAPKCCHGGAETQNPCQKYGVYYETENVLLCPQHYNLFLLKQKTGNKKMANGGGDGGGDGGDGGEISGCCAILKSGKNIGRKCGTRCIEGEKMKYCKKHYKIYSDN